MKIYAMVPALLIGSVALTYWLVRDLLWRDAPKWSWEN